MKEKNSRSFRVIPNRSDEGLKLETSAFELFTVAIYIINSVDNTKLPCYALPPTQHKVSLDLTPLFLDVKKICILYIPNEKLEEILRYKKLYPSLIIFLKILIVSIMVFEVGGFYFVWNHTCNFTVERRVSSRKIVCRMRAAALV